ncbi:MAG: hypothetical protein ACLT4Y_09065 [Bifidobacterium breve]
MKGAEAVGSLVARCCAAGSPRICPPTWSCSVMDELRGRDVVPRMCPSPAKTDSARSRHRTLASPHINLDEIGSHAVDLVLERLDGGDHAVKLPVKEFIRRRGARWKDRQ